MPKEHKETRIAVVRFAVEFEQRIAISPGMVERVRAGDEDALKSVATKLHARLAKQCSIPSYVKEASIIITDDFPRKTPACPRTVQRRLRGMSKAGKRSTDAQG